MSSEKIIVVRDFMLSEYRLKGISLLMFAVIYNFSSLGQSCFMSIECWLDLLQCSRSQFFKAKNELVNKKYIVSNSKGLVVSSLHNLYECEEELKEAIRIAKTPWLDVD